MTKRPFSAKGVRATIPLELVHTDVCGPINIQARGGYEYFITFTDNYSRYDYVYLMHHKSEVLEKFKEYRAEIEKQLDKNIKKLRSDRDEHVQDLTSYNEALIDRDVEFWKKVMNQEMESMYSNKVWELIDAPNGVKLVGCKWIYKRKRRVDGKVETFKVRLVAKGFTQKEGIDYEETFFLVAMLKSIRIMLSIVVVLDYKIWQIDVKTVFLNRHLEENIYMQQPNGFIQKGQEHMVCKLQRSIYGLKQVSQSWNIRFDQAIKSFGFIQNIDEPDSTTEAEYVAASEAAKEIVWLHKFLQDLEVVPVITAPLKLFYDNSGAVAQSKELRNHKKQKHIESKYHLIRDIVQRGDVKFTQIASQQNLADPFTKAIPGKPFNLHLESMGMCEMPNML
ncbi:Integrase catalytic domain-containing protein [Citrus sinensis]|nr:Integrase catalytic domain-containing protein [Citrus sinensis]